LAFMAIISLYLDKLLKVINVANNTAAGNISEMISGIENRKYAAIEETEALLLRNILIFSKKSTIR